ncbi:hypothetical protein L7F22_029386 [Adiantum nelumboides]|nr:hypothetical protein [Adiantum nelumboides]
MGALRKQQYISSRADSDWRVAKVQKDFAGHIFVCSSSTIPDLERMIFGLPARYEETVRCIRKGMPLFLFNYTKRLLYGIFEAASDGGFNIDPYAWENTDLPRGRYGHPVSRYPAQVRVRIREEGPPLDEPTFRPVLEHVDGPKFRLDLTTQQVQQLLHLFGTSPLERELHVGKNGYSRRVAAISLRDPESPRSAYKSDSDSYSDCSSRGLNSGEDDWPDETLVNKLHYHHDDEEGMLRERLSHTALNESETYDDGHFDIPATLADQLSACCYSGEDVAWKESFQGAPHCATPDYDSPMVLRLTENDPAVNSNSGNCNENGLDHQIAVNGQENTLAMPLLSSQMQFPFPGNENMIFIPVQTVHCQQRDSSDFPGHSQGGKWNDNKRSSWGNLQKQSFRAKDSRYSKQQMPSDSQNGHVQPQKLQVLVPFCTQGSGQVGDGHVATVLSPMFMPASGPLAFAQLQTGARVDESGQSFDVSNDIQVLPDRLQQLLQNGQGPILLMPSIIPRPPPVHPAGSITASLVGALHFEILQFSRWTRPSSEIQLHVEAAIDCVRRGVKTVWPDADVEVFGSFATGLCLQHSDVDLAVVDAPRLPCSENLSIAQVSASLIRELAAGLKMYEWCESINPLDTASMPVLKCLCRPFNPPSSTTPAIAVDITIGGTRNVAACADQVLRPGKFITRHTGGAAREYVLQKIRELPALAPLVLLLKSFLHHKGLSNVYSGGLGSFSLTLLVAFFLERVAAKEGGMDMRTCDFPTSPSASPLSCSSDFSDDSDTPSSSSSFGATSSSECGSQSLGEFYVRRAADTIERVLCLWDQNGLPQLGALLLGFLQTFGCLRDLSREKIVLKGIDGSPGGFFGRDDRHVALWIDDPLRPGVNIGAGSFGMVHVQNAFKQMLQVLISCPTVLMSLQCEDKDCQDLAAMSHSPYLRRLVVEAGEFQ